MKKYMVEITDRITGATSPIEVITAPDDYTAEQYIEDCVNNADEEFLNMILESEVTLIEVE